MKATLEFRRTIPAHPMGIIQQRPRSLAKPRSNPAEWFYYVRMKAYYDSLP